MKDKYAEEQEKKFESVPSSDDDELEEDNDSISLSELPEIHAESERTPGVPLLDIRELLEANRKKEKEEKRAKDKSDGNESSESGSPPATKKLKKEEEKRVIKDGSSGGSVADSSSESGSSPCKKKVKKSPLVNSSKTNQPMTMTMNTHPELKNALDKPRVL